MAQRLNPLNIPNIPDILGKTVEDDPQLRQILIAIKTTVEKLSNVTTDQWDALLNDNDTRST